MAKDRLDGVGLALLLGVQLLLAFNQIVIKVVNAGLQPVFFAGLRSLLAVVFVWAWMAWRGRPPRIAAGTVGRGWLMGLAFSAEFLFLFLALDLTTVGRASILMYSMPLWFAAPGPFRAGRADHPQKAAWPCAGLRGHRLGDPGAGRWRGRQPDRRSLRAGRGLGLGAVHAYIARRPAARRGPRDAAVLDGPGLGPDPAAGRAGLRPAAARSAPGCMSWGWSFRPAVVVAGGFIAWLWLLSVYPASTVAALFLPDPGAGDPDGGSALRRNALALDSRRRRRWWRPGSC
jgi:hypothetical protein